MLPFAEMKANSLHRNGRKVFHVAVIIPRGTKPYQEWISGILRYAATHPEWDLFIFGAHSDNEVIDDLSGWHTDGIITVPELFTANTMKGALSARAYAIANGRDIIPPRGCENFGAIICDNFAVGRVVAQFFMKKRHRHFAFVGMPTAQTWSADRKAGFVHELGKNGFSCSVFSNPDGSGWASEERRLAAFLQSLPKPCAILTAVDSRAKHILDVCRLIGINVPKQIQVLGVDNEEMICEWTQPSLSSIQLDFESAGYRLAEMLDSLMRNKEVSPRIQTYGIRGIVERLSTMDLSGSARIVSLAREFIRRNSASDVTIGDIAKAAGCSERLLQRHFRHIAGKTPVEELCEHRLERVCAMLNATMTPIDRIGELCGFASNSYLKATFKRHFGCSMSDWRKRGGQAPARAGSKTRRQARKAESATA